VDNFRKFFSYF